MTWKWEARRTGEGTMSGEGGGGRDDVADQELAEKGECSQRTRLGFGATIQNLDRQKSCRWEWIRKKGRANAEARFLLFMVVLDMLAARAYTIIFSGLWSLLRQRQYIVLRTHLMSKRFEAKESLAQR
ncbi:hypothetical protein LX32DRAFT_367918 [Colletotrichum zoysiae]|uniref:Uncharacterized protein n=1 Tax=Colletotrichum zoysiae TaxID=1216348 RepID=A0AAD9M932_9PEZI|nr:hypothetical protein LX32DRAFT_367918 [Colletotrichum zoysiae]